MSFVRTLTVAVLVLAPSMACDGRSKKPLPRDVKSGPTIAIFDLRAGTPEVSVKGPLKLEARDESFFRLLRSVRHVENDKDVRGVFIRFGEMGIAHAEEFAGALEALRKRGTPIHCHADGYSNASYMAAARGCSTISVSPAGELETVGLTAQIIYLRKLLVDELKMNIDILQVGKYKGAEEPLTRDGPSDEARQSLEGYLASARQQWIATITAGRPKATAAAEDGPFGPVSAKENGLVDAIGYADDEADALRALVHAEREYVAFGAAKAEGIEGLLDGLKAGRAPIALLRVNGSIQMGASGGFGGGDGIYEGKVSKLVLELERDDAVKAVVLRIDSPGGSALASDLIWHRLMNLRKKKPVVVSVAGMAASGGYYLASTGNVIFADATSLLGSIGVVGGKIGFGGSLERFGVHAETFSAKPGDAAAGRRGAYASPLVAWDEPTKVRVRTSMQGVYSLFLARLAEGRNLPVSVIEPSAEGRIFGGEEAKRRQLVDEIGGLNLAVERARVLAALPGGADVEEVAEEGGGLGAFLTGGAGASGAAGTSLLPMAFQGQATSAIRVASSFLPFMAGEHIVLAAPFGLEIR
jgi:protease IV